MTVLRPSRLIAFLTTLVLYVNSTSAYNPKDLRAAEAFKVALANHVPFLTTDHLKVDIAPRSQQGPPRSNNNNNDERSPPGGRSNGSPHESHEPAAQERPLSLPFNRFSHYSGQLPNFMPPAYRSNSPPQNPGSPASRPNSPGVDQIEVPQIDWNARLASLPQTASLPRFLPQPQRRPPRHQRGGSPSPPPTYERQIPADHHYILGGVPRRHAYPARLVPANTRHSGASGSNHRHQSGAASPVPANLPPAYQYMPPARMHMPVPVNNPHTHTSGAATGASGSNHLHQSGPSHSPPTSRPSSPSGSSTKSTRQSGKGKGKGKAKGKTRDDGKGVKRPRTRSPSPGPSSNRARH